jgi:chromosome segregation ATPase
LTELDSRTPETLNTIYEQISRGTVVPSDLVWLMTQPDGRHHEPAQLIADLYVGYSHLQVELEERERELEQVLALKEKQEKEARHDKLEAENHQLRVQQIHAKFVDSENSLRHRLEASRTREEKLQVDLLAASQQRDSLTEFVSTLQASVKKREDLIAAAEARHEDAEKATVNLRIRLADALNGARHALEQRDRQAKLASEKECLVQSTAEELRVALAKITDAEDEITRLHARIRRERDRQVREMKELLDEQARMQDRHEADVHQMSRQAQDAQVQLNRLYQILSRIDSGSQSSFGELRLPRHRSRTRTTESRGTGQPPESLDISTPPISPAFQSTSSRFFTNFSLLLPRQDRRDPSISQAPELHHISTWFEEVSGAARAQHAAMEDLLERMCQLEFEHAQEVESSELEKSHLLDELAVTREQLRLTQEEICQLRHDLDREKEMRRDVETHIEHELDMCQAKLEAVQDARRTGRIKFIEAIELLRLRSANAESLKVEAEDTRFRCEQVTFLSAALQQRVTDLEAELRTLKSARLCSTPTQATIRSPFIRPADTGLLTTDFCDLVR